jgi:hypothetical protein
MARRLRGSDDYRMEHRPADAASGAPLHDLTANGVYPADVYTHASWYAHDNDEYEGWYAALRRRDKPRAWQTMYRALPCGEPRKPRMFRQGDWVTLSKNYAKSHAKHPSDPSKDMCVIEARARAECLFTSGDSLAEWGYWCEHKRGTTISRPRRKLTTAEREQRNLERRQARTMGRLRARRIERVYADGRVERMWR